MPTPRLLQPGEEAQYAALRREMLTAAPRSFGSSPDSDRKCDVEQLRASLARGITSEPEWAIAVVEENAKLLAAAGVIREEKPKRRHMAMIWGVYCTPSARGLGRGRAVVQHAVHTARQWPGIDAISLSVSEGSPAARALYESMGFVTWGIEPDAFRIEGSMSEWHMQLRL